VPKATVLGLAEEESEPLVNKVNSDPTSATIYNAATKCLKFTAAVYNVGTNVYLLFA